MMNNNIIPQVGLIGKFKVESPLDGLINPNIEYTTYAIEAITKMLDDNIDVKQVIYIDQGLTEDIYNSDLDNNIVIVTLKSSGGQFFYIPSNKFLSIPESTGKVFVQKILMVNLDYIPAELDVDFVASEVNDLVKSMTGINTTTTVENVSDKLIVGYEEADAYELNRQAAISKKNTNAQKVAELEVVLETYKVKIQALADKLNIT